MKVILLSYLRNSRQRILGKGFGRSKNYDLFLFSWSFCHISKLIHCRYWLYIYILILNNFNCVCVHWFDLSAPKTMSPPPYTTIPLRPLHRLHPLRPLESPLCNSYTTWYFNYYSWNWFNQSWCNSIELNICSHKKYFFSFHIRKFKYIIPLSIVFGFSGQIRKLTVKSK